jgi:hypothetical protein
VFCNPEYVTDIQNVHTELHITTDGGPMRMHKKCTVPHLRRQWFNDNLITNIIALCNISKMFRVTMDTNKEKALLVHMPGKILRFREMKCGLYAMNPKDPDHQFDIEGQAQMVQTLTDNLKFLSPRQQKRAYRAHQLYDALGAPTVNDLKATIIMNLIRNNTVSTADVNLAAKTFGADVSNIKGKTTRRRPTPVTSNIIEVPDELLELQKDVVISIDGLTVNSLKFLTTI